MVTELGAASVPVIVFITITGYLVCLLLAELSAMMPDRSGGLPSYAYPAYKDRWPRFAEHVNGFTAWAYWLGWFPVAPINVILTASYLAVLFNFSPGHTIDPVGTTWGTPIGLTLVGVCFALLLLIFIPSYLGIRLGAAFATVLGVLSMLPITAMIFLPFFKSGSLHWGNVAGFHTPAGCRVATLSRFQTLMLAIAISSIASLGSS